jgi:PI-3-kinase-related kinase SMG-1
MQSARVSWLPAGAAARCAALAAWGGGDTAAAGELQEAASWEGVAHSAQGCALRALVAASRAPPSAAAQRLQAASEELLKQAKTLSLSPGSGLSAEPALLDTLTQLAGVQLAAQAQRGASLLALLPAPSEPERGFSAWEASGEGGDASGQQHTATQLLAATASLPPSASAGLRIAAAGGARRDGNPACCARLLAEAERSLVSLPPESLAELRLQQLLLAGPGSAAAAAAAAEAEVEMQLRCASGGEARQAAGVRARLALALHSPERYAELAGASPADAEMWWKYAQHMRGAAEADEPAAGAPAAGMRWAAAALGCCRALALRGGGAPGGSLPALLLLLRVLRQHGALLDPAPTRQALEAVPVAAWLPAATQLLALLATSEVAWVQHSTHSTLLRLAAAAPAAVLMPALAELSVDDNDATATATDTDTPQARPCQEALHRLVDACRAAAPQRVSQLQAAMAALSRLAVLEDERWHAVLLEAHAAAAARLAAVYAQCKGGSDAERAALAPEAYRAALAPVGLALAAHLAAAEAAGPRTPHEEAFYKAALPRVRWLLAQLALPLALPLALGGDAGAKGGGGLEAALQRPLAAIQKVAREVAAGLGAGNLILADVSPPLAALQGACVPVPGAPPGVELASVGPAVRVLPTKTRPKRVVLHGSDGQQYQYLVKGREDLRIDERLMQVLRAGNTAAAGGAGGAAAARAGLASHVLAAAPVSRQAGLVGWVEGSFPLSELLATWQSSTKTPAARPADQWHAALRAAGVDVSAPRDTWPAPGLRAALAALERAAPRGMLSEELAGGAAGAADWWRRQRAFAASAAAGSVLGWALGLGDRHLDNVLLRARAGALVHVDFNVVFDRGARLAVPEVVPFRLTQSLVAGLGVTGEGIRTTRRI